MTEREINPISSVGATWPPAEATNNRIRGFYESTVETPSDINTFVSEFEHYKNDLANHPDFDRLSIRTVASLGAISAFDQAGLAIEGAMPIRSQDELMVVYTAWNHPTRRASEEKLGEHREFLGKVATEDRDTHDKVANLNSRGFIPRMIGPSTPEAEKAALVSRFTELYGAFGYDQSQVEELLLDPANTIAYIEDETGVISTAMAERAEIKVEGLGDLTMAEITEAFTLPRRRKEGLYMLISGYLTAQLVEGSHQTLDVLYGEGNLAVPGVVIAAHQNGRRLSYMDREWLGITQPNFGILEQNFHVSDGEETRRFNDFALSYVPLD